MEKQNIVTINGRAYDAATGMPVTVKKPRTPTARPRPSTTDVHKSPQRSHTLNRRLARKNSPATASRPSTGRTMDIAKSSTITKFAPHPVTTPTKNERTIQPKNRASRPDKPAAPHPIAARAIQRHEAKRQSAKKPTALSAQQIKDQVVADALKKASPNYQTEPGFFRRHSRKMMITLIVAAVLVVSGYLTYVNLPVLSVSFAASQAGIKATFPRYTPDGYHLDQPITYSDGKVQLTFVSNSGTGRYVISQSRSSWDSSAVLTNIVQKQAGDDYVVTKDSGLTIYTYQGNAAWVNGGILYTIENSAPLSEQIRTIATSM